MKLIESSNQFKLINKTSDNEAASRCFLIEYPQKFKNFSLRAELKLEFTEVKKYWIERKRPIIPPSKFSLSE